jgi:hypothetical protein
MPDPTRDDDQDEPIEEVVRDTVDEAHDETTRREAVEQELEDRDRSDEGADLEVSELVDSPAAGVIDEDRTDPPEPSEPG